MFLEYIKVKYIKIRAWNPTVVCFNIVNEVVEIGMNMTMIDKFSHNKVKMD